MSDYPIHPIALTYPAMTEAELEALTIDISARGLKRKIVLYQGHVLDGRCRLEACKRAAVDPEFEEYTGDDPLAYANSLNLTRDMTQAQRALVAARQWAGMPEKKAGRPAKGNVPKNGDISRGTAAYLAKHFRVAKTAVEQAKSLLDNAPDLAALVESRDLSLAAAYGKHVDRVTEQKQMKALAERIDMEAVSNGEITIDQALQEAAKLEREKADREAAEADARRSVLTKFRDVLAWSDQFFDGRTDADLAWFFAPDAPGTFSHGVTAERLRGLATQLERLADAHAAAEG